MEEERISVRQWQDKFLAGDFEDKSHSTQCAAGWYDWFCKTESLSGRLKKIGRVVMGITDPFILDNYYVWFKNNCPLNGPLYDDVRFEPLTGERDGKYFLVSLNSPHERQRWSLITERYGYETPEFECANLRDMVKYINAMAPDLEQGVRPAFIAEKEAAAKYFAQTEGKQFSGKVYREGGGRYSCQNFRSRETKTVLVVSSLEDAPPDSAHTATKQGDFYALPVSDAPAQSRQKPKHRQQER